jgi:6-phosphogluconolactonase
MKFLPHYIARVTFPAAVLLAVAACGGVGSSPPTMTTTYSIGGTVSGMDAGQSLVLQNNGGDSLTLSANGTFTFATKVMSGGAFAVTVAVAPAGKTCTVTHGSGIASADVSSVAVDCVSPPPLTYSIGGTVSGLVGQGLELELFRPPSTNRGHRIDIEVLPVSGNGDFVFKTTLASDGSYGVGVAQQPHSPAQSCVVSLKYARFGMLTANATDVGVACGESAYVTNAGDHTISAFAVDATTGAIASAGPPVTIGQAAYAIASATDKRYLYVANSGVNSVSVFGFEPGSAKLSTVPGSPFLAGTNPRALSIYTEGVGTYAGPIVVSYLYVANAGSDDLSAYWVDQVTGVPTPLSPASYATGARPSAMAIGRSGVSPFLYTANTGGSNDISAFLIDSWGDLTPIPGSPYPAGSSVSSLAFGGTGGEFLYAANASGSTATIYGFSINPLFDPNSGTIDPNAGALTSLPGFPYALPSCNGIVADQTGAYLYAAARTNVHGYRIDPLTGALSLLPGFPVAVGANADSVTIDSTNQFLYVRSSSAGTVTGFELNSATGEFTPMPHSPFAVGKSADFFATF